MTKSSKLGKVIRLALFLVVILSGLVSECRAQADTAQTNTTNSTEEEPPVPAVIIDPYDLPPNQGPYKDNYWFKMDERGVDYREWVMHTYAWNARWHKQIIIQMNYLEWARNGQFRSIFVRYHRAICVFQTEFQEHQVKLSLAIMDALADVYKEHQGVTYEFDQYMKKHKRHYDAGKMRISTEVINVYNKGNMQLKMCWRDGMCTTARKEIVDEFDDDLSIEFLCIRLFRNGIPQPVALFNRICNSDNIDYDKFDRHEFKKLVRHLMRMPDANDTIKIEDMSEINPENQTYCVYSGPNVSTKFVFQYMANFHHEIPMYELYNETEYPEYELLCVTPAFNASKKGEGVEVLDTLNAWVHVEVVLRRPRYYNHLRSNFDSQTYSTSTLLYVRPNDTDAEEQERVLALLSESLAQVSALRAEHSYVGRVEFAYADFQDVDDEHQEQLQDLPEPFVVLIEPQEIGQSYYHVFPGRSCINDVPKVGNAQNATEITDFVHRFYRGDLMPILLNENIEETMAKNDTLAKFITEQRANWTFINAAQLDRIARDDLSFDFMVMSCEIEDSQCQWNFGKVREIAWMFGHEVTMYFMDINKNKVYIRSIHQKFLLDDFKIGMYFKGPAELYHPEPFYPSQALDGLITFQSTEMNMFYHNLQWIRQWAKIHPVKLLSLPFNVLQNLDMLLQGPQTTSITDPMARLPVNNKERSSNRQSALPTA